MSVLMEKFKKIGGIKGEILSESAMFNNKDTINVKIPSLNMALSGDFITGGLLSGSTVIAGPSRHFKSNIGLVLVAAYLDKYPEAICFFYDNEFGITNDYLKNQGIDPARVLHLPFMNMEELSFDLTQKVDDITRGDKIIIFIDSIGNAASKKESDNALKGNEAEDMTRSRKIKSFWRVITPHINFKDIPCISINHTYKTLELYAKDVISGGTGVMLSANTAIIVGKQQDKDKDGDINGYNFVLNIEKSRFIKEKSKIPLKVTYNGGISKWSGILDWAQESGDVIKPKNGYYQIVDRESGELIGKPVKEPATECEEFLGVVYKRPEFQLFVKNKYKLAILDKINEDDIFEEEID